LFPCVHHVIPFSSCHPVFILSSCFHLVILNVIVFVILNEVKDLTHEPTGFFATEAQNDRQ